MDTVMGRVMGRVMGGVTDTLRMRPGSGGIIDTVLVVVGIMVIGLASAALNAVVQGPRIACAEVGALAGCGDSRPGDDTQRWEGGKLALHEPGGRRG